MQWLEGCSHQVPVCQVSASKCSFRHNAGCIKYYSYFPDIPYGQKISCKITPVKIKAGFVSYRQQCHRKRVLCLFSSADKSQESAKLSSFTLTVGKELQKTAQVSGGWATYKTCNGQTCSCSARALGWQGGTSSFQHSTRLQLIHRHPQGQLPQAQRSLAGVVMWLCSGRGVAADMGCACITQCKSGYHKSCCLLTLPVNLCWPGLCGTRLVGSPCKIISCVPGNAIPIDHFPAGLYWFSLIQCKCFACRKGSVNVPMRSKSVLLSLLLFKSYCHSCVAFLHSVHAYSWGE